MIAPPPLAPTESPPRIYARGSCARSHVRMLHWRERIHYLDTYAYARAWGGAFLTPERHAYSVSPFVKYVIPFLKYKISLSHTQDFYSKLERSETNHFKGVLSILVYI